jgi:hypothetical protein
MPATVLLSALSALPAGEGGGAGGGAGGEAGAATGFFAARRGAILSVAAACCRCPVAGRRKPMARFFRA